MIPTDERQSLGLAGQFLISWKLMQLGFTVKAFGANAPADLWVPELRILVEAKVAQKGYTKNKHKGKEFLTGCYPFNMTNLSSHFVVVWTLDINKFYIIPTTQLKIGVNRIYPMGKKWGHYQDNWSILKATILPDTDK